MYKIFLVIIACFLFKYLISPTDVILCMGPEEENVFDAYAQNNPISKSQMVSDPSTYWQNNPVDNDAYAQHQRAMAQNSTGLPVRDTFYDSVLHTTDVAATASPIVKGSGYFIFKRKVCWFIWERYTGNYNNYNEFKKVWDRNPSIRKTILNDIRNRKR